MATIKNITFKSEARAAVMNYLAAKANAKAAVDNEKRAKLACKAIFEELGKAFRSAKAEKTSFLYGTIQEHGQATTIVYKETEVSGSIDWQAYAMSLGGTTAGAEAFRKESTTRVAIDVATTKQLQEIAAQNK